ncbi:MAG: hypothetical protein SangKO_003740 [Sandaracinaceae bacterium]
MGSLSARCVLLLILAAPHAGHAQARGADRGREPEVEAEAAFRAGVEASSREAWREAVGHFERSLALAPRVAAAFDLVIAYGHVDSPRGLLRAHDHLVRLADPERHAELLDRVRPLSEAALDRVALVHFALDPPESEVLVDGEPEAARAYLEPGAHVVRARAPGHEDGETAIDVAAGQQLTVTLALSPRAPAELIGRVSLEAGVAPIPAAPSLQLEEPALGPIPALAIASWAAAGALWVGAGAIHGWAISESTTLSAADPTQAGFLSSTRRYADLRSAGALLSAAAGVVTLAALVPWARQLTESPPWWMTVIGGLLAVAGLALVIRPPERLAETRLTDPYRSLGVSVLDAGLTVGLSPAALWLGGALP